MLVWLISVPLAGATPPPITCDSPDIDCTCKSMFALALAHEHGATDCDTDAVVPCAWDSTGVTAHCTANEYFDSVYERPTDPTLRDPASAQSPQGNLLAVFLPDCLDGTDTCGIGERLRCVDGTRPAYWIDLADEPSNDWTFSFQGGGSCGRSKDYTGGDTCWAYYSGTNDTGANPRLKRTPDDMTGWHRPGTRADGLVGPELARRGTGLNRPASPHFSSFHRVYVPKCGFDRGNGRAFYTDGSPDPDTGGRPQNAHGDSFHLAFRGRDILSAVLADLATASTVQDWRTDPPSELERPGLDTASRVVLAGHSGGSHGLIHNLDDVTVELQALTPEATDIRALIDARGWPSLNHIVAKRDPTRALTLFDAADDNTLFCPGCLPGTPNVDASGAVYRDFGDTAARETYLGVDYDASCLSTLAADGQQWRCRDSAHVLWNHLSTPFFLRQAVEDSKHVSGRAPEFAMDDDYLWSDPAVYRERVVDQVQDFIAWIDDRTLTGPREPAGYAWTVYLGLGAFYPVSESHDGVFASAFFEEAMAPGQSCSFLATTYEEAVVNWLEGQGPSQLIAPREASRPLQGDETCQ